jgi:hypothetical protein
MYTLEIEIPLAATDPNETKGVGKFEVHRRFKSVKKQIAYLVLGKQPIKPLTSFIISVTRYSSRTMDFDNLIASLKPHLDGLKLAKIIHGDGWKYIKDIPRDQVISDEKKLVIRITEVAPPIKVTRSNENE